VARVGYSTQVLEDALGRPPYILTIPLTSAPLVFLLWSLGGRSLTVPYRSLQGIPRTVWPYRPVGEWTRTPTYSVRLL